MQHINKLENNDAKKKNQQKERPVNCNKNNLNNKILKIYIYYQKYTPTFHEASLFSHPLPPSCRQPNPHIFF